MEGSGVVGLCRHDRNERLPLEAILWRACPSPPCFTNGALTRFTNHEKGNYGKEQTWSGAGLPFHFWLRGRTNFLMVRPPEAGFFGGGADFCQKCEPPRWLRRRGEVNNCVHMSKKLYGSIISRRGFQKKGLR